jgi:integrase
VKQVEAVVKQGREGRHRVAPGLYLQIEAPKPGVGARCSWLFRYQIAGRSRAMGLGALADVTLAKARERAEELRVVVRGGVDPIQARAAQARAAAAEAARAAVPTFKVVAEEYVAAQRNGWKNEKHADQWTSTLAAYAYPAIGALPVDAVTTDHVLDILKPIWMTKAETASRVRGRLEAVLDAAKVRGWRSGENPARWSGHLALLLPRKAKVAKVEHHAALPWQQTPAFWGSLADRTGTAAAALGFAILTAARSGEVRGMTWGEVDLEGRLWIIPAARMKAGREHRVPLTDAALALLKVAKPEAPDPERLVFPGQGGGALSDMSLTMLLRKMTRPGTKAAWTDAAGQTITAHGFRSTFRDWAGEATHHPREVIEQALAHGLKDKAEAAYARGDLLTKRAALMSDWAFFCTKPAQADVVRFPSAVVAAS